ncbi:MAG: mandelate racemase [Verrucomicrobiae bacterium]|nr:mandelate racemase [Verrucomicrobiae bacterium]
MRIEAIRTRTIRLHAEYGNATVNFSEMTGSLVAILANPDSAKTPMVGFGFGSIGRYAHSEMIRDRFAKRILQSNPEEYLDDGGFPDPVRLNQIMRRNEKQGGHGERPVAIGAVDMAAWDLYAKLQGKPLYQCLAERFNQGNHDSSVQVYAAGGYYYEKDGLSRLKQELEGYLEQGFESVKIKIGGASQKEDLRRIEAAVSVVGSPEMLAVDANCRFSEEEAVEWGIALEELGLRWYEEPVDPLDFQAFNTLCRSYAPPVATGENLFSLEDTKNLIRYAGLRSDRDILQMDPGLSYGVTEYVKILDLLEEEGWSRRQCYPHGGNLFNLHVAQGLQIGGTEVYPGVFGPLGGFGESVDVSRGRSAAPKLPGIGWESKPELLDCFEALFEIEK